MKLFENAILTMSDLNNAIASEEDIKRAKEHGEHISSANDDYHVEGYVMLGVLYITKVVELPQ